jgi:hypothetical protein
MHYMEDHLPCGHCGFRGPIEYKDTVLLKREQEEITGYGTAEGAHSVGVWVCPVCDEPTIWSWVFFDDLSVDTAERRLFPTVRDNNAVPARVRTRLDAALKVKKLDPDFYAVGIRRMLETVCNEERAKGRDLFAKLDDLADKGRIPDMLAEVAHELRRLGNLGAHDEDVSVAHEDVPVIEDLADAVLEYLYRAPAKLAAVREGLEQRTGATSGGEPE